MGWFDSDTIKTSISLISCVLAIVAALSAAKSRRKIRLDLFTSRRGDWKLALNKNVEQEKYLAYQGAYLATKLRSALGVMLPDPNATELLEELDGLSSYHERLLKVRKYDIDLVSQLKPDSSKIEMLLDAVDTDRGIGETIHNKAFEVIFERARDAIESLKNKSI